MKKAVMMSAVVLMGVGFVHAQSVKQAAQGRMQRVREVGRAWQKAPQGKFKAAGKEYKRMRDAKHAERKEQRMKQKEQRARQKELRAQQKEQKARDMQLRKTLGLPEKPLTSEQVRARALRI